MVDAERTVGELIAAGAATLADAKIPEPRREAIRLFGDLTGRQSMLMPDQFVPPDVISRFAASVERRSAGEPIAYVTGTTGFRHLTLMCDRRALIPRPETEGLVEAALARVRTGIAADVGTGTGAIALALRQEGAFDEVVGVDLSPDALSLARANGKVTDLRVTWLHGDLLEPLRGRSLDLLVSNPPYLSEAEYHTLDRTVRDYEPEIALRAGVDGQQFVRRLLGDASEVMAPGGWIALEVDCRRAEASAEMARRSGWTEVTVLDDLFGRARYVLARQGSAA